MAFGVVLAKKSAVVLSESFRRVDERSWALDLSGGATAATHIECRDACFFLTSTGRA